MYNDLYEEAFLEGYEAALEELYGDEDIYQDAYNEGYEAAILTESIFNEKGYAKYVSKCKAKGKTPLPFKQWKRNNILKTVGVSAAAGTVGLTAGGLKAGSDYKNYKKGKDYANSETDKGNNKCVFFDNKGDYATGELSYKDFTNRDLINLGKRLNNIQQRKEDDSKEKKIYNKYYKHATKNKNFISYDEPKPLEFFLNRGYI